MTKKNSIAVFCASSDGINPIYAQGARALGEALAKDGRKVVYGSGRRGLMGVVANAAHDNGGYVVGVNLKRFSNPLYTMEVDENYMTHTLQERKVQLLAHADAAIALPGGIGTLDELMDVYAMLQLDLTQKPMGLLNINGFYTPLMAFFQSMMKEGFLKPKYERLLIMRDDPKALLDALDAFEPIID